MLIEDLQLLHCVLALVEITAVCQQHILTDNPTYGSLAGFMFYETYDMPVLGILSVVLISKCLQHWFHCEHCSMYVN